MSDAQKLIADVLLSHISRYRSGHYECEEPDCDWQGATLDAYAEHQAAEIDKALGGLTREFRTQGYMPAPEVTARAAANATGLPLLAQWVSNWSEVRP